MQRFSPAVRSFQIIDREVQRLCRGVGLAQRGYVDFLQLPACRKIHCYESLFVVAIVLAESLILLPVHPVGFCAKRASQICGETQPSADRPCAPQAPESKLLPLGPIGEAGALTTRADDSSPVQL